MQNSTLTAFEQILKDAHDKANNRNQKSLDKIVKKPAKVEVKPIPVIVPQPVKQDEVKPIARPEISTFTLDEVLNGKTEQEPAKDETKYSFEGESLTVAEIGKRLTMKEYSEKSFVLYGKETKVIKDELRSMGGAFNRFLRDGAGWVFSKKKAYTVRKFLQIAA